MEIKRSIFVYIFALSSSESNNLLGHNYHLYNVLAGNYIKGANTAIYYSNIVFIASASLYAVDTWRNKIIIMTSKRRCEVVLAL